MIKSFFLFSTTGEVLIEKHFRGVTPRTICEYFWEQVNKHEFKQEMPPVVNHSKYYLISIYRSGIFLLATTMRETQPLIVIEFLHRVFEIFEEYFGSISDENTIKENFATIYQLLEEMMDFGYPIITEPNTLRDMVSPPNNNILSRITNATIGGSTVSDVLPDGTVSNMPWRKTGVKYSQNEVYVDIVEEVDAVVDRNGSLISSEVTGIVTANCRLSGVPDLLLTFMNPQLIDDNCSFHPCVRYSRFEKDKVISFVPPDGVFELMRYRVNTDGPASGPCYCQPLISFDYPNNQGSMTLQVGAKPSHSIVISNGKNQALVVEDVEVIILFSRNVRTVNIKVTIGTAIFDEATKTVKWELGKLVPEQYPQLTGTILLQANNNQTATKTEAPTVELNWKVPMGTISGLSVSSLLLTNETYKPYKGVRAMARSGKYQVRTL